MLFHLCTQSLARTIFIRRLLVNILDLVEEEGLTPKKKAACHGGEYCSPCPFCKEGKDRFLTWPYRNNQQNGYQGGRYSCRKCGNYGDAITFLRQLYGFGYLEACARLRIEPRQGSASSLPRLALKPKIVGEPPELWKEKAKSFSVWAYNQLQNNSKALKLLKERGFNDASITRFCFGFNPQTLFRKRQDWGLSSELRENGEFRELWLPAGIVIPTFSAGQLIKVKVRRLDWREGDKFPKYVEISGSKQAPSIYGDTSLPCALVLESEIDALLIQQEAGDLVYCVALGGSTKLPNDQTEQLLRNTSMILFLPDFDQAGAIAWSKWKKLFANMQRILTPCEKSAGDYYQNGGDLRKWLEDCIKEIQRKLNIKSQKSDAI